MPGMATGMAEHASSYTGHDISDELRAQGMDAMSASMSMQSSEELGGGGAPPPPEGYSTPSRRVIREIIV